MQTCCTTDITVVRWAAEAKHLLGGHWMAEEAEGSQEGPHMLVHICLLTYTQESLHHPRPPIQRGRVWNQDRSFRQ